MEVLLGLEPLHILLEKQANLSYFRHRICGYTTRSTVTPEAIRRSKLGLMPSDKILPTFIWRKPYQILLPSREDWKESRINTAHGLTLYTDGSKTTSGTGVGIYGKKPNIRISANIGTHPTVFQAEVTAIKLCAEEISKMGFTFTTINILSDSQAALNALQNCCITSKTVLDCVGCLSQLAETNKVHLFWIPGHEGHQGNEEADKLAKLGSLSQPTELAHLVGVSPTLVKQELHQWGKYKHQQYWT